MEPKRSSLRPISIRTFVASSVLMMVTACAPQGSEALREEHQSTRAVLSQSSQEQLLVPSPRDVLGRWRLVSVRGTKPPQNALLGLRMTERDHRHWAIWSDGLNDHSVRWHLTRSGQFRRGETSVTAVGCVGTCTQPSGFGVATASELRVTANGQLVFLNGRGRETARYRR